MTKFTPGPWGSAARQGDDWDSVVYQQCNPNLEVCQCFHASRSLAATDRCEATTHLISAAPEMHEALNECRELLLSGYTTKEGKEYLAQDVYDALAKITTALAKADRGGER